MVLRSRVEFRDAVVIARVLSTGAKVGIAIVVIAFVIAISMVAAYAVKQKRRAKRAEEQNKPFGESFWHDLSAIYDQGWPDSES